MSLVIKEFSSELQPYFDSLNRSWINEYFTLETIDEFVLTRPEEAIIQHGGKILFLLTPTDCIATVALKPINKTTIELTKMAVDKPFRSKGFGKTLCKEAILLAKKLNYKTIILYTNSSLKNAIHMYKKMGFEYIDIEDGVYKRADVKMKLDLS